MTINKNTTMDWYKKIQFSEAPVYKAIAHGIANAVNQGELRPSDKLPTQRYLSKVIGCTVGTITRAYKYAEDMGLVVSVIGSGSYIKTQSDLGFSIPETDKKDLINLSINTPSLHSRAGLCSAKWLNELNSH
jgi:DNA-binding transcriptional regulator YhcF (GntR family)